MDHEAILDEILTHSIAALLAKGLVDLERVAQDDMRVRASAGSSSFHRRKTLEDCLRVAQEQVTLHKQELDGQPEGPPNASERPSNRGPANDRNGYSKSCSA